MYNYVVLNRSNPPPPSIRRDLWSGSGVQNSIFFKANWGIRYHKLRANTDGIRYVNILINSFWSISFGLFIKVFLLLNYSTLDLYLKENCLFSLMLVILTLLVVPRQSRGATLNLEGKLRLLPDTLCRLESASPLLVFGLLGELLSTPPSRGRRWLTETCSMNEVPYFLKYHHSKI